MRLIITCWFRDRKYMQVSMKSICITMYSHLTLVVEQNTRIVADTLRIGPVKQMLSSDLCLSVQATIRATFCTVGYLHEQYIRSRFVEPIEVRGLVVYGCYACEYETLNCL